MLLLLLTVALMIIMAGVIVPSITFEVKRDREEEMIHRGVQYSRAIRAYYKKFGRYPMKVEDLENTNQLRFLRKRYKDPLTGKDFKLLHFGEAKMTMNGMSAGAIPGAAVVGANGSLNTPNGITQVSGNNSAFGGNSSFGQNSSLGQNSQNANSQNNPSDSTQAGTDSSQPGPSTPGTSAAGQGQNNSSSGDKLASTTFGGAPIVGVASTSKEKTIREFDKKKKYNEWQFVYDPTLDRGFLITTPYQPQLQMFGAAPQNVNGPGAAGQNGMGQNGTSSGFGNSFGNGFGNSNGMQNNPTSPGGGINSPSQPTNPPPQQPPQ